MAENKVKAKSEEVKAEESKVEETTKAEVKTETKSTEEKASVKVEPKLEKIIDEVAKLSTLELSQLVKALEEKFGVQAMAAAPVATAGAPAAGAPVAEEKTNFTVVMTDSGANKINVIKALREIKPDLGLKEAKDMTEKLPAEILVDAKKEVAAEAKQKIEAAGGKVELK